MSADDVGGLAALAGAVASGRLRAVDLVAASLARIERHDAKLGAVVALRADPAMADAEQVDLAVAAGQRLGPLAGLPVLVKDLEDVEGMRTTKGSLLFADAPAATSDGLVPGRLRGAGAIVVGKTNLPEFAIEGFTSNLLFGTTRNPWDLELSPGGSSGGSAAAMAAGLAAFATATDGGGSIRIPAALCGLVGIKPTNGVVGRRPIPDWIDFSTDGPFATSVADLRLLLGVIAGPVAGDPTALSSSLPVARPPGRLLAAYRTAPLGPLPAPVAAAFEGAVAAMSDLLGLPVTWLESDAVFPDGNPDLDWFTSAAAEHVSAWGRDFVHRGLVRMHPSSQTFFADGLAVTLDEYLAARRRRFDYVRTFDELLAGDAVLLTPTVAVAGFLADGRLTVDAPVGLLPPEVYSTAVQNITGHPAITLPAGRTGGGLPFGLQVTAARFADESLLDLAVRWESAHPWPLSAPGYQPFTLTTLTPT